MNGSSSRPTVLSIVAQPMLTPTPSAHHALPPHARTTNHSDRSVKKMNSESLNNACSSISSEPPSITTAAGTKPRPIGARARRTTSNSSNPLANPKPCCTIVTRIR